MSICRRSPAQLLAILGTRCGTPGPRCGVGHGNKFHLFTPSLTSSASTCMVREPFPCATRVPLTGPRQRAGNGPTGLAVRRYGDRLGSARRGWIAKALASAVSRRVTPARYTWRLWRVLRQLRDAVNDCRYRRRGHRHRPLPHGNRVAGAARPARHLAITRRHPELPHRSSPNHQRCPPTAVLARPLVRGRILSAKTKIAKQGQHGGYGRSVTTYE